MKQKWFSPAGIGILGLLLLISCTAGIRWYKTCQPDQLAAERWGEDAVQVSCYLSGQIPLQTDGIAAIREGITQKLENDLGEADGTWYDAYSCDAGTVSVIGQQTSKKYADLTLVSENYFRIHPYPLQSGNWLSQADCAARRVVLEKTAAWNLFGSTDIVGQHVTLENGIFEVAGVISMPDDFASQAVSENDMPRIFLLYSDYAACSGTEPAITVYEAVLPELVKTYGITLLQDVLKSVSASWEDDMPDSEQTEQPYQIVQNTDRFSISGVWSYLRRHTDYLLREKAIAYPDSENAALVLLHRISMLTLGALTGVLLLAAAAVLAGIRFRAPCLAAGKKFLQEGKKQIAFRYQVWHQKMKTRKGE